MGSGDTENLFVDPTVVPRDKRRFGPENLKLTSVFHRLNVVGNVVSHIYVVYRKV